MKQGNFKMNIYMQGDRQLRIEISPEVDFAIDPLREAYKNEFMMSEKFSENGLNVYVLQLQPDEADDIFKLCKKALTEVFAKNIGKTLGDQTN